VRAILLRAAAPGYGKARLKEIRQRLLWCLILAAWAHLFIFLGFARIDPDFMGQPLLPLEREQRLVEVTLEIGPPAPPEIPPNIPAPEIQRPLPALETAPPLAEGPPLPEIPPSAESGQSLSFDLVAPPTEEVFDNETETFDLARNTPLRPYGQEGLAAENKPDNTVSVEESAPRLKSYNTTVRTAVARHWLLPPEARSNFQPGRFTAVMTLDRQGQVLLIMVEESSGSSALDYAAMEALRGAAPYEPFPEELQAFSQLNFRIHFDYRAIMRQARPIGSPNPY
jgi:TonB family protein